MTDIPELNGPSDLRTRHRDAQEYQVFRRQPPLSNRIHEALDARAGEIQLQRSSLGLRGFDPTSRLENLGAGGVSTTGRPGHLGCRVGVSVSVGRKGHGSAGLGVCPLAFRPG